MLTNETVTASTREAENGTVVLARPSSPKPRIFWVPSPLVVVTVTTAIGREADPGPSSASRSRHRRPFSAPAGLTSTCLAAMWSTAVRRVAVGASFVRRALAARVGLGQCRPSAYDARVSRLAATKRVYSRLKPPFDLSTVVRALVE